MLTEIQVTEMISDRVREMIKNDDIDNIDPFEPIINYGINSIRVIELLVEIEKALDISIDDDDLITGNLETISKISMIVYKKVNI